MRTKLRKNILKLANGSISKPASRGSRPRRLAPPSQQINGRDKYLSQYQNQEQQRVPVAFYYVVELVPNENVPATSVQDVRRPDIHT